MPQAAEPRDRSRRRRRIFAGLLLIAIAAFLYFLSTRQSGLYNNRSDASEAMQEHQLFWARMNWGREFSRLNVYAVIRSRGGTCITEEADWETVDLGQRLDMVRSRPGTLIACHVDVRGSWPFNFMNVYRWTTLLEPVSDEQLRLRETRRQRDTI